MTTLTIEILNPKARSILDGLEDAGLIAIAESAKPAKTRSLMELQGLGAEIWRDENVDEFLKQKSVDELAEEQRVSPIDDPDRLFGCGKDLWETEEEWNVYLESIRAGRNEKG